MAEREKRGLLIPSSSDNEGEPEQPKRNAPLTSGDLRYILEANKKSVEIYLEVEKQNEEIQNRLESIEELLKSNEHSVKSIDQNFFKLVAVIGTIGVGAALSIVKTLLGH